MCISTIPVLSITSCGRQHIYYDLHALSPYLHYVEYDDYTTDRSVLDGAPSNTHWDFGCSSIRSVTDEFDKPGDFYGRNFDYYYSNIASFVVKVKANKEKQRLASIGVANLPILLEDRVLYDEKTEHYDPIIEYVPNITTDGMNECGVVCNMNVCSLEDAGEYSGTNPGKERLFMMRACREILDHATCVEDAIQLLKSKDCYIDDELFDSNLHFMIADANKTVLVEMYDNDLTIINMSDETDPYYQKPIMTNWYLSMTEERAKQTWIAKRPQSEPTPDPELNKIVNINGQGTERYAKLYEAYDNIKTFADMYEAMKGAWISQTYLSKDRAEWPSEDIDQYCKTNSRVFNNWENSEDEYIGEVGKGGYKFLYKDYHEIIKNSDREHGPLHDVWITQHTTIFQFSTKTLWVISDEDYPNTFTFKI